MKKLFAVAAILTIILSFAACSNGGNLNDSSSKNGIVSDVESTVSSIGSDISSALDSNVSESSNNHSNNGSNTSSNK